MKNLFKLFLIMNLLVGTIYADNGQNGTMDKLTNDSAFSNTSTLFNEATSDSSDSAASILAGVATIPAAAIESIIWLVVLPFNAIKLGIED